MVCSRECVAGGPRVGWGRNMGIGILVGDVDFMGVSSFFLDI